MFPSFPENQQFIPYFLCGKILFEKCKPPDSKFYLGKLIIKFSHIIFSLISLQYKIQKSKENLTLHHMGKIFISLHIWIKYKIWIATFLKSVSQLKMFEMDFLFSGNNGNIKCALV